MYIDILIRSDAFYNLCEEMKYTFNYTAYQPKFAQNTSTHTLPRNAVLDFEESLVLVCDRASGQCLAHGTPTHWESESGIIYVHRREGIF